MLYDASRYVYRGKETEARCGTRLIHDGIATGRDGKTFIYVNNRLEGNALMTIAAMLEQASS